MKKTLSILSAAVLTLGVSGVALAGSTSVGNTTALLPGPIAYSFESTGGSGTAFAPGGGTSKTFTLPATAISQVNRQLAVIPNVGTNIIVDVQLLNGANFVPTANLVTAAGATHITWAGTNCGVLAPVPAAAGDFVGATELRMTFTVNPPACTALPVITWAPTAGNTAASLGIEDVNNVLGSAGGVINIQMRVLDPTNAGLEIDPGGNPAAFLTSAQALSATIASTKATIDVAQSKKKFVAAGGSPADTTSTDRDGTVQLKKNVALYLDRTTGTAWDPAGAGQVQGFLTWTLSGDFSSVSGVAFANPSTLYPMTIAGTAPTQTASITLDTADTGIYVADEIAIKNDGTVMIPRTITVSGTYFQGPCAGPLGAGPGVGCAGVLKETLTSGTTFTVWALNGVTFLAPWLNGNNAVYNSRLYICTDQYTGPTSPVDVVLFRVTATGTNIATPLATFTTTYQSSTTGCINIKGYEDLLVAGGVVTAGTPYVTDNGNFAAVLTLRATQGYGVANVLNFTSTVPGGTAVGTYVLIGGAGVP